MAEETEKPVESPAAEAEEISLENIDDILQEEDPEFLDSLDDISKVGDELADVELETLEVEVSEDDEDIPKFNLSKKVAEKIEKKFPLIKKFSALKQKFFNFLNHRWVILKGRLRLGVINAVELAKTIPDRLKKIAVDLKKVAQFLGSKLSQWNQVTTRIEKSFVLVLVFGLGILSGLVMLNLKKGQWIPFLETPLVLSMAEVADKHWDYNINTETVPFLTAFPQEKHNYLFPKIVVNLKKTSSPNAFTMGAFEFFVEVDSKDTAIELKSREVEFHDLIQRVTEGFSYNSLQSERGKERLKEEIKKALNQKIVQGWVKEVFIKFMITKP